MLPLSQQFCIIIYHRYAAEKAIAHTRNNRSNIHTMCFLKRPARSNAAIHNVGSGKTHRGRGVDEGCENICKKSESWAPGKKGVTRREKYLCGAKEKKNGKRCSKATIGDCSFSFASSSITHFISNDLRCTLSLSSSKSLLKKYLFRSVYKD